MKKIQVKVCVCTACVMNGSVEIMESVESLRDLREQMEEGYTAEEHEVLEIATDKCLGGCLLYTSRNQTNSALDFVRGKGV